MKKNILIHSLTIGLALFLTSGMVAQEKPPFRVGEKLIYQVHYKKIIGGYASIEIKEQKKYEGRDALVIESRAKSVSEVDLFFKLRDQIVSLWDWKNKVPLKTYKNLNEGFYYRRYFAKFYQDKGYAAYEQKEYKGNTNTGKRNRDAKWKSSKGGHKINSEVQDIVTAVYMMRSDTRQPKVGQNFSIPIYDDGKLTRLKMQIVKAEKVKTPAGTFDAIKVKPKFTTTGFFKHKGSLYVWVSNDKNRYPLKVEATLPIVGSLVVELIEVK